MSVLFLISLFKNISYPLLWADEGMTVMHGERVLQYGYPKVHDGKNVVYDLRHSNPELGIDEKTDAYIGGPNWAMYYVAALGVKFAKMSDDIFIKTAILRIPFAILGLMGLMIFAFHGAQFFGSQSSKRVFFVLFAFFELISVPLVLHLREARYYPLTVFVTALVIFVYTRHKILKKTSYLRYAVLLTFSLFLMFVTFSPIYFIFLVAIFLHESMAFLKELFSKYIGKSSRIALGTPFSLSKPFKCYLRDTLPLIFSLIAVFPLILFFNPFYIAEEMAKFKILSLGISQWDLYLANLFIISKYFTSFDFICLAIFLKFCLLLSFRRFGVNHVSSSDVCKLTFSNFLTILFIVYFFAIGRVPNALFTRYFIPLQPVLALMIILDVSLVYSFISLRPSPGHNYYKVILVIVFASFIFANISKNMEYIKGHVYELFQQYKGPLDYLIPFIKETYRDTDKIVIATNYEETSFMFYLGSRVIIGFTGNNLEQDTRMVPDIVIFRKGWRTFLDPGIFAAFLGRHHYQRVSFPVLDYNVNNIPELNLWPPYQHQFQTFNTEDENKKVDIFLKR